MRNSMQLRKKAESEYSALAKGMKSMSEGFRADIQWLKADLAKSEAKVDHKHSALSTLQATRTGDDSTTHTSIERLEQAQREFNATFGSTLQGAVRDIRASVRQSEVAAAEAAEVRVEYARFRRTIEEYERGEEGATG